MIVLLIASLIALATCGAGCLVLRTLTRPQVSTEDMNDWIDINWQNCRPLERLLDPTEFQFLRDRGLSKERIKQLRFQRQKLFRLYLRRLTHDFNGVHAVLKMAMVNSASDRPDLAQELATQRIAFHRALIGVEFRLVLYAAGFDTAPSMDLIRPMERLHARFCELMPAMSGAPA